MITQRTSRGTIEIDANGTVRVRLELEVVNGSNVIASTPHRMTIAPGEDAEAQMDIVSANIVSQGYGPIDNDTRSVVVAHVDAAQTPDVIAAYRAAVANQAE